MDDSYAAGFFDGEGCVNIFSGKSGYLSVQVIIGNTRRRVLEILMEKYGGGIYAHKMHSKNHRQAYQWRLCGEIAIEFVNKIRPYSVIKIEQLDLVVEFWKHKHLPGRKFGRRNRPEVVFQDLEFKRKMHILNFRGIPNASG
jgi:hypothetical protein